MRKLYVCLAMISAPLVISLLSISGLHIAGVLALLVPTLPVVAVVVGLAATLVALFLGVDATSSVVIGL